MSHSFHQHNILDKPCHVCMSRHSPVSLLTHAAGHKIQAENQNSTLKTCSRSEVTQRDLSLTKNVSSIKIHLTLKQSKLHQRGMTLQEWRLPVEQVNPFVLLPQPVSFGTRWVCCVFFHLLSYLQSAEDVPSDSLC